MLQAQATQQINEQLLREMLVKHILETQRLAAKDEPLKKDLATDAEKENGHNTGQPCKRARDEEEKTTEHNAQEIATDEARKVFEEKRRKDDFETTKRERERAQNASRGRGSQPKITLNLELAYSRLIVTKYRAVQGNIIHYVLQRGYVFNRIIPQLLKHNGIAYFVLLETRDTGVFCLMSLAS